jgi:hypothetical protein
MMKIDDVDESEIKKLSENILSQSTFNGYSILKRKTGMQEIPLINSNQN